MTIYIRARSPQPDTVQEHYLIQFWADAKWGDGWLDRGPDIYLTLGDARKIKEAAERDGQGQYGYRIIKETITRSEVIE